MQLVISKFKKNHQIQLVVSHIFVHGKPMNSVCISSTTLGQMQLSVEKAGWIREFKNGIYFLKHYAVHGSQLSSNLAQIC